ncbi:helix-turn-helix domain-containing protein [Amycolatopsis sp. NPDC051128]|uniref:helix-turn-helix domain-containing protein n=1 Tax=Amycolatopsis sp. NPDC051128 TaxID=3155412 RepID=UPI003432972B
MSSIVNTSEVLKILHAAGEKGAPVVEATRYLATSIRVHALPRHEGGRGEHTRFVCFGLRGLVEFPHFVLRQDVLEAILWCLGWLEEHQTEGGWPEVAGINDASIHQTTLAIIALSRLRDVLLEYGSGYELVGDAVTVDTVLNRIGPLILHGLHGFLYHRRTSGAWGWRTYVDTAPSPSKTALCLLATSAAIGRAEEDNQWSIDASAQFDVGGATDDLAQMSLQDVVAQATQWLLRSHERWEYLIEDDKDVQGTAWNHMAYGLCVHAALEGGANPYDERLVKAWKYMASLWDAESKMWAEPGASATIPTVRAAYYTVCAYEQARLRLGDIGMSEQLASIRAAGRGGESDDVAVSAVRLEANGTIVIETESGSYKCAVSENLLKLVQVLISEPSKPRSRQELAVEMRISENSVSQYVKRLNEKIEKASDGRIVRLVRSQSAAGGRGYQLPT